MIEIITTCPICGETDTVLLSEEQYKQYVKWQRRELLIQDALPGLTASQREQLITGICPSCWHDMFGE